MPSITISIDQPLIPTHTLEHYKQLLMPEVVRCAQNPYAFCTVVSDNSSLQSVMTAVAQKKALKPTILFVIGMGGSNLGTLAVTQALLGSYYNDVTNTVRIYYLDTIDTDYINSLLTFAQQALEAGQSILLNIISKSGITTETSVNFELFLTLLKKYHPTDYSSYIVVTTDKGSPLWHIADQQCWITLEIPRELGGRYSIFSAVGLFPLAMLDIDIESLLHGAQDATSLCLRQTNDVIIYAAWQYALCKKGYAVNNLFIFSQALSGFGLWWRQLVGESLGKQTTKNAVANHDVMLPVVSMGPTDLHAIGQLYLANIIPITTTFVSFKHDTSSVIIDQQQKFSSFVPNIRGQTTTTILQSILQGVKQAYDIKQLPYATIVLPEKNAYYMGQFLQLCMFEIVYVAYLMNVNPFDQPAVELYKQQTRKILSNE